VLLYKKVSLYLLEKGTYRLQICMREAVFSNREANVRVVPVRSLAIRKKICMQAANTRRTLNKICKGNQGHPFY
jgi:hypothetical protein